MFTGIRLKLIDNANLVIKKWSFIFNSIGTVALAYLTLAPDAIITMYNALPDELKSYIPVKYSLYVTLTLYILGLISQYVKQQKLEALKNKDDKNVPL